MSAEQRNECHSEPFAAQAANDRRGSLRTWIAPAVHGGTVLAAWGVVGGWLVVESWRRSGVGLWEDIARRAADFYLASTVLLLLIVLLRPWFRDLLTRLSLITAGLAGLAVLGVALLLPGLPRQSIPWDRLALWFGTAEFAGSDSPSSDLELGLASSQRPDTAAWRDRSTAPRATSVDPDQVRSADAQPASPPTAWTERYGVAGLRSLLGKLYLAGAAGMIVWLAAGAARVAGLVTRSRPAPPWIREELNRIAGRGGWRVRALVTDELVGAAAVGGPRPAILLPAGRIETESPVSQASATDGSTRTSDGSTLAAAGDNAARVRAVLAHEWAHIRFGDLRRMALARVLWVPLFAHPLFWWLRRAQRLDQELLADQAAVASSGMEPAEYAGLLIEWAKDGRLRVEWAAEMLGIGSPSSHLSRRIAVLLTDFKPFVNDNRLGSRWQYAGVLAAVAIAAALSMVTLWKAPTVWAASKAGSVRVKDSTKPDPNATDSPKKPLSGMATESSRQAAREKEKEMAMYDARSSLAESIRNPEDCKPDLELPGEARRKAVSQALSWLVRHQSADGGWRMVHGASCPVKQADGQGACDGAGTATADTASTGMALLALMAAGHRPGIEGPYRAAIDHGVEWLLTQQTDDGRLYQQNGLSGTMYSQGIATLALCEAFHGSRADRLKMPAQKGLDFIARAQDKNGGGWRYTPGMPGDTSVLGWQVLALRSGQQAGLAVEPATLDGARKFLQSVAGGPNGEFYAYTPAGAPAANPSTLTAVGTLAKQLINAKPDDKAVLKGVELLASVKPEMGAQRDAYRWFFASQAIDRSTDVAARVAWQSELSVVLVRSQVREGCAAGSWDPAKPQPDKWAQIGGRMMVTALSTIALSAEERRLAILIASRTALD
ncbi:MAG: M56 family metallopeptidase [Planctomycetota bacterium]